MPYRVLLTDKAEMDVEAVLRWFREQRATDAGARWLAELMAKLDTLESHPDRCPLAAEAEDVGHNIRELLFGRRQYKYRILFTVIGKTVPILRIWRGSRNAITPADLSR